MGCCLAVVLLAGAPRLALFLWWLFDPSRVLDPFGSFAVFPAFVWLLLGFIFLPWTAIAFIFVAPGGIVVIDWVIIALGLALDLGAFGGGSRYYRSRYV